MFDYAHNVQSDFPHGRGKSAEAALFDESGNFTAKSSETDNKNSSFKADDNQLDGYNLIDR